MKRSLRWRVPTLVLCVLLASLTCPGQESRATLTGRVSDPNGAAVPGATVSVTNQQTSLTDTATTNDEGNYTVPFLLPGRYTVKVEAQGFKAAESNAVELHTADKATFDVTLEVGGVGEVVNVNAEAPLLEPDTASRGQVIERERVAELPLVGRNPLNLATLAPGVTFNGNIAFQRPFDNGDNVNFSINGGINRHNDFLLDGTPNNSITDANASRTVSSNNIAFVPSAEATEEFKIQTNSYDAQFGRTGGGTVNITIKSGGREFHGSLYEFARRYQLNANRFSNNARGQQLTGPCAGQEASPRFLRDPLTCANLGGNKIDQYGGVISGPVLLPRFGEGGKVFANGREKTFFLFNYEGYKELTPVAGFTTVPTLLERQGDFSQSGITIFDPLTTTCNGAGVCTRSAFPGNVIPANRINVVGRNIINSFPLPNTGSATQRSNNLFVTNDAFGTDDFHSWVARVDHRVSDRQSFFVRFVENRRDQFQISDANLRTGLGVDEQGPLVRKNYGVVVDSTTTLSPTTVFNVRLGFTRFLQAAFRQRASPFDATSIGFSPAFAAARPVSIVPRITFNDPAIGIPEFGSRNPNSNITNTWSVPAYLTHFTGNHTFKFGGEYRRFQINQSGGSFNFGGGVFCFNGQFTAANPNNIRGGGGGAAFADLLLGAPAANLNLQCNGNGGVSQLENVSPTTFEWGYYAGYVQDDWKVTPKLTLNLGFRYDYEAPPRERFNRQNRGFAFDQASPLAAAVRNSNAANCPACANLTGGLLFAGVGGSDEGAFDPDRDNFQPRIGVAYQWNEKTVLRGGYGLFYFPSAEYGGATGFSIITPFSGTLTGGGANQFIPRADALNNPFPAGLTQPTGSSLGLGTALGSALTFTNPERDIPRIHQFSAGIQRELPARIKLDVSYVGSRSEGILTGDAQGQGGRNVNVLSAAQLAQARADSTFLTTSVANPFAGLIPNNPTLNAANIARSQLLLPFPQFGAVTLNGENVGKLWYNSLQATAEKRLSRGLVGVISYTFSKNIGALGFLNDQDAEPARSVVNFDSPHVFVASGVYQLPFGRGQRFFHDAGKAANLLVGGFEYNVIGSYRSGVPIDLPGNVDLIADPRLDDPQLSVQTVPGTTATYFNNCVRQLNGTSFQFVTNNAGARVQQTCSNPAFAIRAANTLRTIPFRLGNLRQPSAWQFDMSLNKSFVFTESMRFQFRAEAFNVFNTPLFGSPDTNATGQNFGVLNPNNGQRNNARQIQLGFKFIF